MRQLVISAETYIFPTYLYTTVVWKEDDAFFIGKAQRGFDLDTVEGKKINNEDIFPPASSGIRICADAIDMFVKVPCLLHYDGSPETIKIPVLQEIECFEKIGKFGTSPYVVQYNGCQVRNGLAVGICLEKCPHKLDDAIDKGLITDVNAFIDKVKQGLEFIHSAGYIHDDINNTNVMVMENGDPKIIDFDSCKPIG
ncbi:hypothetical protein EV183_004018, partial [Coemansia sp. RSA 2336]